MQTVTYTISLSNAGLIIDIAMHSARVFGYESEDLIGESFLKLIPQYFQQSFSESWLAFISSPTPEQPEIRVNGLHSEGYEMPLVVWFLYAESDADAPEFSIEFSDLSRRDILQQELNAIQHHYSLLAEAATDAIIQVDHSLEVLFANNAILRILGFTVEEIEHRHLSILFPEEQLEQYEEQFQKYFVIDDEDRDETGLTSTIEVLGRHKNGDIVPLEISMGNSRGLGDNRVLTCIIRDISLRKQAERRLKYLAYHDKLTTLGNRDRFHESLNGILDSVKDKEDRFAALLYLDLDGFKKVNDSLGHEIGDAILKACANRLMNCLREGDQVYRFQFEEIFRLGGDEFTILLPFISEPEDAAIVATRVIGSITQPFNLEGWRAISNVGLGVSIGIAVIPRDGEDTTTLLRNADAAMYRAKERGNDYSFFTEEMNSMAMERLMLEDGLRQALAKNEFHLVYQPIVNEQGEIHSLEVLVRWLHPDRGLISPEIFISIAEETGLITPLGKWILNTACNDIKALHDKGFDKVNVSVNLSPYQLQRENIADSVHGILERADLSPSFLVLELTETSIMENPELAIQKMNDIKTFNPGVKIAIDDFGTGYSSLSYLSEFPVDNLKIDRSFVMNMDNGNNSKIIRTIINLGNILGLNVIAEGTETKEQIQFLAENMCHYYQGNFFSEPCSIDEIAGLLAERVPYAEAVTFQPEDV